MATPDMPAFPKQALTPTPDQLPLEDLSEDRVLARALRGTHAGMRVPVLGEFPVLRLLAVGGTLSPAGRTTAEEFEQAIIKTVGDLLSTLPTIEQQENKTTRGRLKVPSMQITGFPDLGFVLVRLAGFDQLVKKEDCLLHCISEAPALPPPRALTRARTVLGFASVAPRLYSGVPARAHLFGPSRDGGGADTPVGPRRDRSVPPTGTRYQSHGHDDRSCCCDVGAQPGARPVAGREPDGRSPVAAGAARLPFRHARAGAG